MNQTEKTIRPAASVSGKLGGRRGFTLVELLVVIGIIAVLISILLPSLSKARTSATKVACAANMRSIGQMFAIYVSNTKGSLPVSMNPTTYYYATTWPTAISYKPVVLETNLYNNPPPVQANVRDRNTFLCPFYANQTTSGRTVERTYVLPGGTYYDTGTAKNNMMWGDRTYTPPGASAPSLRPLRKVGKIGNPSETVMVMESVPREDPWSGAASFSMGGEPYGTANFYVWINDLKGPWAHNLKDANYLYIDGHVESITPPVKYTKGADWYTIYSINKFSFSRKFSVNKNYNCQDAGN